MLVFFLTIRQHHIRDRMKEELEKQLLHTITVSNEDIHWVKKGKELLINGRMFDVKNAEQKTGSTTFKGLYDDEETFLINQLDKSRNKRSPANDQLLSGFFKCLLSIFFDESGYALYSPDKSHLSPGYVFPGLLSQFLAIISPPPKSHVICRG